jgi:hypothetical protein
MRLIPGAAESYARGLDPALDNPGDPLQRLFNYPRAWYLFFRLPMTQDWSEPMAMASIAIFLAGVCLFSDRLTFLSAGLLLLALFSPAGMLAMSRANTDILVFAAMALSLLLLEKHAIGALLVLLGAIVFKIIPILGAGLFLGTERRVGLRAVFATILFTLLYFLVTMNDMVYIFGHTQKGYEESYGLAVLPDLLRDLAHDRLVRAGPALFYQVVSALNGLLIRFPFLPYAAALVLLILFTYLGSTRQHAPPAGTLRNQRAFWMGAGMYIGTFWIGNNWDYRLIFLIFTIPQLPDWAVHGQGQRTRQAFSIAALFLLFRSLWSFLLGPWMATAFALGAAYASVLDEVANWALYATLIYLLAASIPTWVFQEIYSLPTKLRPLKVIGVP